jgi:hypothetical protein
VTVVTTVSLAVAANVRVAEIVVVSYSVKVATPLIGVTVVLVVATSRSVYVLTVGSRVVMVQAV